MKCVQFQLDHDVHEIEILRLHSTIALCTLDLGWGFIRVGLGSVQDLPCYFKKCVIWLCQSSLFCEYCVFLISVLAPLGCIRWAVIFRGVVYGWRGHPIQTYAKQSGGLPLVCRSSYFGLPTRENCMANLNWVCFLWILLDGQGGRVLESRICIYVWGLFGGVSFFFWNLQLQRAAQWWTMIGKYSW